MKIALDIITKKGSQASNLTFLGMASMPIPLWCPFDTVDNILALLILTIIFLSFYNIAVKTYKNGG